MQPIDTIKARSKIGGYKVHGTNGDVDCVIGFSFGFRKRASHVEPGQSNQDMARLINKLYARLPKIVQFEIADALPKEAYRTGIYRIEKHRESEEYLDTREVAAQAKAIMDSHGWKRAVVVAHPYHMPRVDAVCQKLGIGVVVPDDLGSIRFDPESEQEWTRDPSSCAENEAKAIDEYAKKGWI